MSNNEPGDGPKMTDGGKKMNKERLAILSGDEDVK
jgi:hypothetical protein